MIIAIDGPAAAGKSTTARRVADTLGFLYLDTGAIYRAIAWYMQQQNLNPDLDTDLDRLESDFLFQISGTVSAPVYRVGDKDVTSLIRNPEVTALLGKVTQNPRIRSFHVDLTRRLGADHSLVVDGRDIGTVIFPDAELKIFLVASLTERVKRRARELKTRGFRVDPRQLARDIAERDQRDQERSVGPLIAANDARHLDTTALTLDDQVRQVLDWAEEKGIRA